MPEVADSVHFFFFVCKTLYEWILINFCFNTWSPFRLSCAMNYPGVCSSQFHNGNNVEREHKTWKLRRGASPLKMLSTAFTDVAWEPLCAFAFCLTKKMLGNYDPLSCFNGCFNVLKGGWVGFSSLPSHCKLQPEQRAMSLGPFRIACPCFELVVLVAQDMGLPISAFSKPGLTSEGMVWPCIGIRSHTSEIFLCHISK